MTDVIGFIGLGLMGSGFTKRLVGTGSRVVGYDLDPAKCEAARSWGVEIAASPAEVAGATDRICLAVTTTKAVAEATLGEDGVASAGRLDGRIVIDFSTTEIPTTRRVADELRARSQAEFIDAPVSGGPRAAEAGTLAIMAGGNEEAIAAARPLAERFGLFTHMGGTGAGQATKLVNQALCLTNYCVVAEGLRLAEAYGVDARRIPEALAPGLGNSAILQAMLPKMIARDFSPLGYARQVLKDLEMLHEATREKHLPMPMVAQATTLYRMLVAQGHSELDATAVAMLLPDVEAGPSVAKQG